MKHATSYIRFSSERQELGDSVRRQLALAEKYAAQHNLTLDTHTYRDLGISAFTGRNAIEGALGAFLKAVESGLIPRDSFLLIESFDRLSRAQVDEALELFLSITRRGITIVTLTDGQVYSKETIKENWTKLIVALAIMSRANEESATKSKRAREVVQNRLASGIPLGNSMAPWLQLDDKKLNYSVVASKAKIVKNIFDLALKGNGVYLIMKSLNEREVPPLRNAARWSVSVVAKILHSQAVIGNLDSKHGIFEGHYPPIIERDAFYQVQVLMDERNTSGKGRKGENVANLFSGLVRCGDCGSMMKFTRSPTGDRARINTHLQCTNSSEKGSCDAPRLNYGPLEKALLKEFLEFRALEVQARTVVDADPTITLRAEITEKKSQVEKLVDLMEASTDSKNLLGRLTKREKELADLEERLRTAVVPTPMGDVWKAATDTLDEHNKLLETPGAELAAVRLKLQSVLKQFVEKIELPSKIVVDKKNKVFGEVRMREALIIYRDAWDLLLIKRDAQARGRSVKRITDEVLEWHEKNKKPTSVLYRVPKIGGGKPGRKGKKSETLPQ